MMVVVYRRVCLCVCGCGGGLCVVVVDGSSGPCVCGNAHRNIGCVGCVGGVLCRCATTWCVWYVYSGVLCMWGLELVMCRYKDDVQWLWVVLVMFIGSIV